MKKLSVLLIVIALASCKSSESNNGAQTEDTVESEIIIRERIDGPANVRDKPSGELMFELFDNVMVDVSEQKKGWHKVELLIELEKAKFKKSEVNYITPGTPIIRDGKKIGEIKTSIEVIPFEIYGSSTLHAELTGFTHHDNIKPYSIIERSIEAKLADSDRSLSGWESLIRKFELENRNLNLNSDISLFENGEVIGPSTGPRIVLVFDEDKLVGLFHSRKVNIEDSKTFKLDRYGSMTFFNDYPNGKRKEIIDRLNNWVVNEMN